MSTQEASPKPTRSGRLKALAVIGLFAGGLYAAPALTELSAAHASGGGKGGGGGSGGGKGGGGGSGAVSAATDPLTAKECGSCHMAYSPSYLPAGSWRQIMGNLSNHFGEDASLGNGQRQQIASYLEMNAGGGGGGSLRITEQPWFTREHGFRATNPFSRGSNKLSNCAGCHTILGQQQRGR